MKIVKPINEAVQKMMPSSYFSETSEYKVSCFCYVYTNSDIHYLMNTLTLEILMINDDQLKKIEIQSFKSVENDPFLQYLYKHYFIVNKDIDEVREYHKIKGMLDFYTNRSKAIHNYTILPTTVCNARCFYCFESDFIPETLSDKQVDDLIDFMAKHHEDKPIKLQWFGGEPLCGIKQIRKISKGLRDLNIPFQSSMISNGSLFDQDIIQEAVSDWNLKSIQITFDGKEELYNSRKNYYVTAYSPFFKVLENTIALHEAGIHISIRLNADMENIEELKDLVDYLDTRFKTKEKVHIYSHPLFGEYNKPYFAKLYKKILDLNEYARSLGFGTSGTIRAKKMRGNFCKANNPNSLVIGADGRLYSCEHCEISQAFGNVSEGITDQTKWQEWKRPLKKKESCQNCVFLPICTDFPYCPDEANYPGCKVMTELKLQQFLKNSIKDDEDDDSSLHTEEIC